MSLDLTDVLQGGQKSDSEDTSKYLAILKDLSDKAKIEAFSDLRPDEVKILTRITFIATLVNKKYKKKILSIDDFVHNFMLFRVSEDRKSRKEFIEGMNSPKVADTESSMLKRMTGRMMGGGGMLR